MLYMGFITGQLVASLYSLSLIIIKLINLILLNLFLASSLRKGKSVVGYSADKFANWKGKFENDCLFVLDYIIQKYVMWGHRFIIRLGI